MPKLLGVDTSGTTVGTMKDFSGLVAPTAYLLTDGRTIGSVASNATSRANADTFPLYKLLWDNFTNTELIIQTSAGAPTTRGPDALTDFSTNNKRMPLPDIRGRTVIGKDDMGGTPAGRVTFAATGITATTLGAAGGVQEYALAALELPAHAHDYTQKSNNAGIAGVDTGLSGASQNAFGNFQQTTATFGSGNAHRNVQPSYVASKIIAYK